MSSDSHPFDTEKNGDKDAAGVVTDVQSLGSLEAMAKSEGIKPQFLAKCQYVLCRT